MLFHLQTKNEFRTTTVVFCGGRTSPPPVSPTDNCKIETTPTLNQDAVAASQDLTHVWAAHWGDRTRKGPKQRTAAEEVGPRTRPPPPTSIPRDAHCVKDATTIGCTSKRVVLC